jgi:hypothetical protein
MKFPYFWNVTRQPRLGYIVIAGAAMMPGETELQMCVRHVAEQEERIARQDILVERLRELGTPILGNALRLLAAMRDLRDTMRDHAAEVLKAGRPYGVLTVPEAEPAARATTARGRRRLQGATWYRGGQTGERGLGMSSSAVTLG